MSVTVIEPVREPLAVGVKVTLMVHEALAARLEPQVLVSEKSPLLAMLEMVSVATLVLDRVMSRGLLLVPTGCDEKFKELGARLACGAKPVPERSTAWVAGLALSVTESEPVREPAAVGVKVTLIVQEAVGARLDPQLLVWEKSPLAVILEIVRAAPPVLVKPIASGELAEPRA